MTTYYLTFVYRGVSSRDATKIEAENPQQAIERFLEAWSRKTTAPSADHLRREAKIWVHLQRYDAVHTYVGPERID